MRFTDALAKTLTPRIAPMVYIMMFVSVFIGFCFGTGYLVGGNESILYTAGVLVHKQAWGWVLFCTASIAEIGMIADKDWMIQLGGMTGFMAWLFAAIALFMQGFWYVLVTVALFHLLFHGYVYLATTMGVLRRAAFSDR